MFVYVVFMLFSVCVCIRVLHVGWLLWLFVGAWVWSCFACRFICSLLPLLKVSLAVAPGVAPYCGFGRCFVPIVWWARLRKSSVESGCKVGLVSR